MSSYSYTPPPSFGTGWGGGGGGSREARDDGSFLPSWSTLMSMGTLPMAVRQHLAAVYAYLGAMMVVTYSTVYATTHGWLPMISPGIATLGVVGTGLAFQWVGASTSPAAKQNPTSSYTTTRRALLAAFAAGQGVLLVPLVMTVRLFHPGVLTQALTSTALIFGSFTAAAVFARRRTMFYLSGLLGSVMSVLTWMTLLNWWLGSRTVWTAEMFLGLLAFSGYIMLDTQVMIYRASLPASVVGPPDAMASAFQLYMDAVAVFVRIVALLKARDEKQGRSRRQDDEDDIHQSRRRRR